MAERCRWGVGSCPTELSLFIFPVHTFCLKAKSVNFLRKLSSLEKTYLLPPDIPKECLHAFFLCVSCRTKPPRCDLSWRCSRRRRERSVSRCGTSARKKTPKPSETFVVREVFPFLGEGNGSDLVYFSRKFNPKRVILFHFLIQYKNAPSRACRASNPFQITFHLNKHLLGCHKVGEGEICGRGWLFTAPCLRTGTWRPSGAPALLTASGRTRLKYFLSANMELQSVISPAAVLVSAAPDAPKLLAPQAPCPAASPRDGFGLREFRRKVGTSSGSSCKRYFCFGAIADGACELIVCQKNLISAGGRNRCPEGLQRWGTGGF